MRKPLSQWTKSDLVDFLKSVDNKTWGKVGVGVIAFALVFVFFIGPAWLGRPKLRREIETMSNQMRLFNALNQKSVIWQEDEKVYTQLIHDTKERIYDEDEVTLLLGQVSRLADKARVDVTASQPRAEVVELPEPYDAQHEVISYDFTVQGRYHALGKLAEGIETYPNLLRIQSIHIVPLADKPSELLGKFGVSAIAEKTPEA